MDVVLNAVVYAVIVVDVGLLLGLAIYVRFDPWS
jgi:hypothetical protein